MLLNHCKYRKPGSIKIWISHLLVFSSLQCFTGKLHILCNESYKSSVAGPEVHKLCENKQNKHVYEMYTYTTYREYISCPTKVESKFYLLLNGIRGALHPPFLERGFVLGVNHRSEGHQLKFIVLKRDLIASLQECFFLNYCKCQFISSLCLKAGMENGTNCWFHVSGKRKKV